MENNGGCFRALGNLLIIFFFFYVLYLMATSKYLIVRLLFWLMMAYGVYIFWYEWTTYPYLYFDEDGFMYKLLS